jgi:alpha-tubulin suppressor-like RCC1 family protein
MMKKWFGLLVGQLTIFLQPKKDSGEIFSWGSNIKNKLGLKDFEGEHLSEPRQLAEFGDKIVFSVSCGTTSLACLG